MSFLSTVRNRIFGGSVSALSVQEADVSDELAKAGEAFGTLMQGVFTAVAQTQQQLDKNGALIAEAMCKTEVEMVRARETRYDDDGNVEDIKVVTGKGRLIELTSPAFYECQYLTLQGEFKASELASSTQSKVRTAGVSGQAGTGAASAAVNRGLFGRKKGSSSSGGGQSVSASASFSDVTTGSTFDSSVGTIRMNTLYAPKDAVAIAQPPLVLVGPKITIIPAGPVTDELGSRSTAVAVQVTKHDGTTAIASRGLVIDTEGTDWTAAGGAPTTDGDGKLIITLTRPQTPGAPPLAPKRVTLTVRLGLVTASAAVDV